MQLNADSRQTPPVNCAIKCQKIILRDYGFDVSVDDLCELSSRYGWFDKAAGVHMRNNGMLFAGFGIPYHHSQNNTIYSLVYELKQGHKVMVNVNHLKLADNSVKYSEAHHALIVTDVDTDSVHVINPSATIQDEKYDVDTFLSAWRDSCCYMLATDEPPIDACHFSNL